MHAHALVAQKQIAYAENQRFQVTDARRR